MATEDWQIKIATVEKRNNHLMETNLYADCSFLVGTGANEKIFQGHKLILASASVVFERMFYGALAEKTSPIVITDVEPRVFQMMLKYIYTIYFKTEDFDAASKLYYAAEKYMLPLLAEKCSNYISSILSTKNCCQIYEFAKKYDESNLMEKSLKIIIENTSEVIAEPSFCDIQDSTLLTILDQNELNLISELDLFNGVVKYFGTEESKAANTDSNLLEEIDDKFKIVRESLKKIRFLTLTPVQFANGPAITNLLRPLESVAIFINISNTSNVYPMPKGWNTSRSIRKRM